MDITITTASTTVVLTLDPASAYGIAWRLYEANAHPTAAQLGTWCTAHAG